jgi:hypothetical protein
MAHWHAMAKLCMHNDLTRDILDTATVSLGKKLRAFSETTCLAFTTKELCREYNARIRRDTTKKAASKTSTSQATSSHGPKTIETQPHATVLAMAHVDIPRGSSGWRHKTLNLSTFKGHSLGDYADTIRTYGTADSFSTEPVRDRRSVF